MKKLEWDPWVTWRAPRLRGASVCLWTPGSSVGKRPCRDVRGQAVAAARLPQVGARATWRPDLGAARFPLEASGLRRERAVRVPALRGPFRSLWLLIGMSGLLGPKRTGHTVAGP